MERGGINNEILITEISKRRCLWDQKSLDYLSRTLKAREWENIASQLCSTVEEVKNRWKLLKDSFNREVRNMSKNAYTVRKWIHFEQMSFLLKGTDTLLLPSAYLSQSLVETDDQNTTASSSFNNELSENSELSAANEEEEEDRKPIIIPRKKFKSSLPQLGTPYEMHTENSSLTQSDERPEWNESAGFRHEHGNEDYYFLMSLLPSFERLPDRQKMLVKIKMMQSVYEASYEVPTPVSHTRPAETDNCLNTVSSGS